MRKFYAFCTTLFLTTTVLSQSSITGFSRQAAADQLKTEARFDKQLNADHIGATIKQLSAYPHHLGSPGGKAVADTIYNRLKSYGWQVKIEEYRVLFPTPRHRALEMVAPKKFKAQLKEKVLSEDATSGQPGQLPTYNAWSADGDLTAPLIFVNYGLPADYEFLERLGINVKGKIVIAKYGRSWRGIKPKLAQEHGAVGCIIYSDPADDGYVAGEVYPKGPFKNETGVQRGSVMDMPVYPGDPLTPDFASTKDAKRIERGAAVNLLKIPVLPIGYKDAQPLLESLSGQVVPATWAGGLPFTYHIGDGQTKIHLAVSFDWDQVSCYNVIATIPGSTYPDEWVVRGNHHDAWVNGASDPISGEATLLEEAKAIGELLKTGWKPKRTLVYCSWDGEEQALLGSTEHVEDHISELKDKAVVYINSDGNGRGFLAAGGSHALQTLVNEVARDVIDPQTGVSVKDRVLARNAVNAKDAGTIKKALSETTIRLSPLGSGSDYSPFFQHVGIPSLNISYGGEESGGEYHSIYDSYDNFIRFKDPGFKYEVALAQTAGRMVLRMSEAELLPFDYTNLAAVIKTYTDELIASTDEMREFTALEKSMKAKNMYDLAADSAKHLAAYVPKPEVPFLDFSALQNAVTALQFAVDSLSGILASDTGLTARKTLNNLLPKAEQHLLIEKGLPGRPWYKHAIYAPGLYTGYGVKTMPYIREAIEERNWAQAKEGIAATTNAILQLTTFLKSIKK